MKTKKPASVIVLAVIRSEGHVMPPHFCKAGENVKTDVYLKVLMEVVVPWMDEGDDGRPYAFQQDSVLASRPRRCRFPWPSTHRTFGPPTSGQPTPLTSTPATSTFESKGWPAAYITRQCPP